MKLTNSEIFESIMVLRNVHEEGKLGYSCARNLRKLSEEAKEFFEIREKLLQKYGTLGENDNYMIEKDKIDSYNKELSEFSEIEIDVDVHQVDEDVFCSGKLDTQQMYTLDWMVKRDES